MPKYDVTILRRKSRDSEPYEETFSFEGNPKMTVAAMLACMNNFDDLTNADGQVTDRIAWECSCNQMMCGACAMVINDEPHLACEVKLETFKTNKLRLEPLSKFPVVKDLIVDRSELNNKLNEMGMWLETDEAKINPKFLELQYAAGKCMKCGLCVEVCFNTAAGSPFWGPYLLPEFFLAKTQSELTGEQKACYNNHFYNHCSKALSCQDVCPAGINMKVLMKNI